MIIFLLTVPKVLLLLLKYVDKEDNTYLLSHTIEVLFYFSARFSLRLPLCMTYLEPKVLNIKASDKEIQFQRCFDLKVLSPNIYSKDMCCCSGCKMPPTLKVKRANQNGIK